MREMGDWFYSLPLAAQHTVKACSFIFTFPMVAIPLIWLERKIVADYQVRIGPNRCGPFGLLQPVADALKLLLKEDITPALADKWIYTLAPMISIVPALMAFAVVPFGPAPFNIAADLNVGLLYALAMSSLNVYALVLAGWASNNKYSLLGGLRSTAQMISYELAMGMALVAIVMSTGETSLGAIVDQQKDLNWNFFKFPLMFAFLIYFIAGIAETNRAPFDLPEAESELVAGFHTEYSSMKFAMFFLAEYLNMVTVSALATSLFFGGWRGPIIDQLEPGLLQSLLAIGCFFSKVAVFIYFYMWARASWPRIRYDRLMSMGWTALLPAAIGLIIINAFVLAFALKAPMATAINALGMVAFFAAFFVAPQQKGTKGPGRKVRLVNPARQAEGS